MASERVGRAPRAPYSRPCPAFGTRVPGKTPGLGASGDSFPISWPHLEPKPRELRGTGGGVGVLGPGSSLLPLIPGSNPARKVLIRTIGVLLSLPGQSHLLLCGPETWTGPPSSSPLFLCSLLLYLAPDPHPSVYPVPVSSEPLKANGLAQMPEHGTPPRDTH